MHTPALPEFVGPPDWDERIAAEIDSEAEADYDADCPDCSGTGEGRTDWSSCRACAGSGLFRKTREYADRYPDDDY